VAWTPAAARWSAIIDRHEASGLSVREFAAANDVHPGTLSWWRWRLGRTRGRRTRSPFVELVVAESQPDNVAQPLVLTLDDLGACIAIHHDTDLLLLRRTLEALC